MHVAHPADHRVVARVKDRLASLCTQPHAFDLADGAWGVLGWVVSQRWIRRRFTALATCEETVPGWSVPRRTAAVWKDRLGHAIASGAVRKERLNVAMTDRPVPI